MKNLFKFLILILFISSAIFYPSPSFAAPLSPPTITSPSTNNVGGWFTNFQASLTSLGNPASVTPGFCFTADSTKTPSLTDPTSFCLVGGTRTTTGTVNLYRSGLSPNTTYYYRGYATNTTGTSYTSGIANFKTLAQVPPTVTDPVVSNVTSTTADTTSSVTSKGYWDMLYSRGVCYNTAGNPELSDLRGIDFTTVNGTTCIPAGGYGANTGPYYTAPSGLNPGTTYYIRSYARNAGYYNQSSDGLLAYSPTVGGITFTTLPPPPPMSGTLVPSSSSCTIILGASSCNVNLSWSITNPESTPTAITASGMTDINVSNTTTPSSQSGTQSNVSVPHGGRTFYLYNYAKSLVPTPPTGTGVTVTSSCASGSAWDGSMCATLGMSGTLTNTTCTIGKDQSSCPISISYNVSNPVNLYGSKVTSNLDNNGNPSSNFLVVSSTNADAGTKIDVSIPFGVIGRNFYLYNNGDPYLAATNVTASCALGLGPDTVNKKCISIVPSPDIKAFNTSPLCVNTTLPSPLPVSYHWTAFYSDSCSSPTGLFPQGTDTVVNRTVPVTESNDYGEDNYTINVTPSDFLTSSMTHDLKCKRTYLDGSTQYFIKSYKLESCDNFKKRPRYTE